MFINKIGKSVQNYTFKGFQHEVNNVGNAVMRFNYPFDYETKQAHVEFFKVKKNNDAEAGYEVIGDKPIARVKIEKGGTAVNLDDITNIDRDETFAYRIVVDGQNPLADTGIKVNNEAFTLVSRTGPTPRVQGAGYLGFPDSQRVGVKHRGFDEPNTGEIYLDKNTRNEMEKVVRTYSNKLGGNLAGLEYNIDYLAQNGYTMQPANPVAGGDNKSAHHYWNKNNFQISDDMGNKENYTSYVRKLFQNGMIYVYDGTFTSEGLEGIHFQYALRWANKNPQSYYWFRMQGLKDQALGLGVVPKNKENLRHRVVNSPVFYNESTKKIEENPNYNPNRETFFQIYDGSQVSDEQLARLDKPIENYEKIKTGNPLEINTHDDTLINYLCEINPKEYKERLEAFIEFNKNSDKPLVLNSPDGTIHVAQFSNFRIDRKTEGGFVAWDANTDMVKMNYHISGYDEKIDQSIVNPTQRDYEKMMRVRGAYEVQDMALQAGRYWTKLTKDTQTIYSAQVLKGARTSEKIQEFINNKLLPKGAYLNPEKVSNVLNGYYNLAPKGVMSKDDVTIKSLMQLPLDSLEFAENTVGVLSTSYFSNRATSQETLGLTRFELMQKENPHLVEPYAKNYLKTNLLFTNDIKNFADEVIKNVDKASSEKLLDSNGDYTEYGEYVIELMGETIAKYALLKSLTGESLKTKILPNGEITYDYVDIKSKTSLKSLGLNATNPQDEAKQLHKLIEKGLAKLNSTDVDYVAKAVFSSINGTNVNSFRLAEAMVKEGAYGLGMRLDAAKDIADQDAGRNGEVSFDENWQNLIDFWKKFVLTIKSENPNAYIVAELTDIADLMRDNLGENANCYADMPEMGFKFKTVPDAMLKFFNETGITSEAAYSYFFTDLLKVFGPDFTDGSTVENVKDRCNKIVWNVQELIGTRGIDYVRNLFTFVGNHDKPRILHGLALDMKLFHGSLSIFDKNGKLDYNLNRSNRIESMLQLANGDDFDSLPLEAKLNIDNPEYFNTVSTYAVAMSQLLRNAINDSMPKVATEEEMKYLKLALVDLTNGNFQAAGKTTQIPSINIPELSSVESALREILKMSEISLTDSEFEAVVKRANDSELIRQFSVQGDFDWSGENASIGERNQKMVETILRGPYENSPSGEWDYKKYSTYTVGVAGLLRQAFIDVKGADAHHRFQFLKGSKEFIKKYDRAAVEANRTKLPFEETFKEAMAKNGYASKDIKTSIEMLVAQAEYRAQKDGKLADDQHFSNANSMILNLWKNSTEPALQKATMMMTFLSALVGLPTIYGGDELGLSGYDEKTKNLYLHCRNPLPWSELEEGIFKDFRERILKAMNGAMSIRSRDGVDALNNGTAYAMSTSNENIPAFMMQDGHGNMTVSVFDATGINVRPRFDYFKHLGITDKNKEKFFADNNIESFNKDNRYVPIQQKQELDYIALGAGISLPIGLVFMNSDNRDKAIYEVKKIIDGTGKVTDKLGIFKRGGKITLDGITAKNGAMVLKHVSKYGKQLAFRGNSNSNIINKQYRIVTNPYVSKEIPVEGQTLSLIAK